jgi:hypothetical protein
MLGGGVRPETVERGLALGADVIAVDGGSTDSGPHYLGTGTAKTSAAAVAYDLRILVTAARAARIPLIVGSCGTSGTDRGVDWIARIVRDIASEHRLSLRMARVYSEQRVDDLVGRLRAGRVSPLVPSGELAAATLRRCTHVVGLMGHEPIEAALREGADIVLCGRATDTAVLAAVPLMKGCPPGPTWHAAKVAECGGLSTDSPASGGVLVSIDDGGFSIEPLSLEASCTPRTVSAHMLYENADPVRMREPAGTLDGSTATYTSIDDRTVRVVGSRFDEAEQHTIKLEGAAACGYETMSFVGIRDPEILGSIEVWSKSFEAALAQRISTVLEVPPTEYQIRTRYYGWNAVLGPLDPDDEARPREVGVVLMVRAADQAAATEIAKLANPLLLHMPLPGMSHMPSYAFMTSPAELERGAVYEFVLQHVVAVEDPCELFRTESEVVEHG